MIGSVIALPVRLTRRGAGMALDGASAIAEHALGLAGHLADVVTGDRDPDLDLDGTEHVPGGREAARPGRDAADSPSGRKRERRPGAGPRPTTPTAEVPTAPNHVSEEATLVDETADPGAQDGAGAEVRVAEPWEGYRELRADDVIDRLSAASTAELAAIELYELAHRRRDAVLTAAQRELERADREDPSRRADPQDQ
jgi:hypothetical protein